MYYPTLKEARTLAASGPYREIPVARELLSDFLTPIQALRILQARDNHCFLLESAADQEGWGRWTFLGFEPELEITAKDGVVQLRDGERTSSRIQRPGKALRQILSEHKSPKIPGQPPFTGGLVGYFSYDYMKYAEPTLRLTGEDQERFKDMDLMLFRSVIAFGNFRQKLILITNADASDLDETYPAACAQLDRMAELLRHGAPAPRRPARLTTPVEALFSRERFCSMVEQAKHYIREGDIFQVVLSNRLEAGFEGSLLDVYRILRTINPSPYLFYFTSDDMELAGASPETLVKLEDGVLHTFPLAGTRPRGRTPEEDRALEEELLSDEKELAEHNMLVDLGRNDIGRSAASAPYRWRSTCPLSDSPTSCTSAPPSGGNCGRTATRWTPLTPSSRRALCREPQSCGRRRSSTSWNTTSGGCTAGPSATWTLPETWTPASPSAWPSQKMGRCSSAPGRALWPTRSRRRSTRSASTRQKPWSGPWSWLRRREIYDSAHRQLRQLFLQSVPAGGEPQPGHPGGAQ